MFLVVMLCGTYSSTMLSFIIFNFPIVFKLSLLFVEIYFFRFKLKNAFINSNKMSDNRKQK